MLRAGIARSVITPPQGMTMAGYAGRQGVATGTDEDLTVTALLLEDGPSRLLLAGFDLTFTPISLAVRIRAALGRILQTPPSNILLNSSHTHCGPTFHSFRYDDDPEQDAMRAAYEDTVVEEMPRLGRKLLDNLQPARLGTAVGEAPIGINRREVDDDGRVILGENPAGTVDHQVRVVRIDDPGGRPIAVVFSHGCHTVSMGPQCLLWSPDYIGPARRLLETNLGCLSLFLQANAGDINPITGIGTGPDNTNEQKRLGWVLGCEALKIHSMIYTESVRGPRTFFGTLARASIYPRVAVQQEPDSSIAAMAVPFPLPLQDLPSAAEARELDAECQADFDALQKQGAEEARLNIARRYCHWSKVLLDWVAAQRKPFLDAAIQVMRVGDFALASFPGETFAAQGLEIKRRSPFSDTLFVGYSNGCFCYIPTRDAFPSEGWSPRKRYHVPDMIFQAYAVPTALRPEAGELMVDEVVRLLHQLCNERH